MLLCSSICSLYVLVMLTPLQKNGIVKLGMSIDITNINESVPESQARGQVTGRTDGLRVLAKIIGRHILAERRGNSVSEDTKKSAARRYHRSDLEDLH